MSLLPILHRFWDSEMAHWSKIVDLNLPHCYLALSLEVIPLQLAAIFGNRTPTNSQVKVNSVWDRLDDVCIDD